jgi:hypothetical protein
MQKRILPAVGIISKHTRALFRASLLQTATIESLLYIYWVKPLWDYSFQKEKYQETIVEISLDVASRHKCEQNFQHEKRVNSQVRKGRWAACAEILIGKKIENFCSQVVFMKFFLKKNFGKTKSLGFTMIYVKVLIWFM